MTTTASTAASMSESVSRDNMRREYGGRVRAKEYAIFRTLYVERRMGSERRGGEHYVMEKLTSVLVVVDRIEAAEALIIKSVGLARQFGARVAVLLREPAHAHTVAQICSRAGYPAVALSVDRHAQRPLAESIAEAAREAGADLVIKAPLAAHPLGRVLLHATDRRVAEACPVPLMLAHARPHHSPPRFAAAVD